MRIGRHILDFEEPDLIVLRVSGDFSDEETVTMLDAVEARVEGAPHLLWLTDLLAAGAVTSRGRKMFVERTHAMPIRATAIIGTELRLRVIASLMTNVMRLLGRSDSPTRFFDTEADARAWLDDRRREIAADRGR